MRLARARPVLALALTWMAVLSPFSVFAGESPSGDGGTPSPQCAVPLAGDGGHATCAVPIHGESTGKYVPAPVTAGQLMAMSPEERRSFMRENAPSARVENFGTNELDEARARLSGQYFEGMAGITDVMAMAAGSGLGTAPTVVSKRAVGVATQQLARVVYPRGPGAATGPVPRGHVQVSRWVSDAEAKQWIANGGTYIPGGVGGESARIYVTVPAAPRPGGTGPIRIDFSVDAAALTPAGKEGWFQIMQPVQNMPIHQVTLTYPPGM